MKKRDVYITYLARAFQLSFAEAEKKFEAACVAAPDIREKSDVELSKEEGVRLLESLISGAADLP